MDVFVLRFVDLLLLVLIWCSFIALFQSIPVPVLAFCLLFIVYKNFAYCYCIYYILYCSVFLVGSKFLVFFKIGLHSQYSDPVSNFLIYILFLPQHTLYRCSLLLIYGIVRVLTCFVLIYSIIWNYCLLSCISDYTLDLVSLGKFLCSYTLFGGFGER